MVSFTTCLRRMALLIVCSVMSSSSCAEAQNDAERDEALASRYAAMLDSERGATDTTNVVARVGARGVVTRAAFEREWSLYPELSREEVLEVLVRRELLLESFGGTQLPLEDEELVRAAALASKRGMVDALIQGEIVKGESSATQNTLTPEQFDALVQREVDRLSSPVGYDASHLLVQVPKDAPEETWQRGREVAAALAKRLEQVQDGRILAAMTKIVLDSNGEQDGFDLAVNGHLKFPMRQGEEASLKDGFIQVVGEFSQGAAELFAKHGAGVLSEPVRTPFGWHLIVVHERFASRSPAIEQVRAELSKKLEEQRVQRALLGYIEPLYGRYNWSTDPTALEDELAVSAGEGQTTQEQMTP